MSPEAQRFGGVIPAAHGVSGTVTQPTLFLAGEAGPEDVNIQPRDNPRARALLSDAFRKALQRLVTAAPGAGMAGGVVSPVGVSAPGTSPELMQAAAGVAAAGRGVRQNVFQREAAEARPTALRQGVLQRTV